jgi:hypothetical protein
MVKCSVWSSYVLPEPLHRNKLSRVALARPPRYAWPARRSLQHDRAMIP